MNRLEDLQQAMFCESFPCNPRPFAQGLTDYLAEQRDSDAIKSDGAKQILWILMAQAYGQLATIDLCSEWDRLNKLNETPPPPSQEQQS